MLNQRQRYGWYLFDFANSALIINGGLYFPQWIVIDKGVSDFYFNLTITSTSALLIATAPVLGLLADRKLGYTVFLRTTSALMFLAALAIAAVAYTDAGGALLAIGLLAFFITMYGYQLSLVFYNAMLGQVATETTYSKVSGFGLASGWLGGIFGIFAILPFVEGYIPYFQPGGREQAFLPSALLFGVLIFASLRLIGTESPTGSHFNSATSPSIRELYSSVFREVGRVFNHNSLLYFLIAYLFFADAVLTIQNNSTIYLEIVMNYDDNAKAMLFLLFLVMAALGAIVSGYSASRYGVRRGLIATLIAWFFTLLVVSATRSDVVFAIIFGLFGFLFGCLWNFSRVLFISLIPTDKRGEYFGVYSSFERFTAILGPVLWSVPVVLIPGALGYRIAMLEMAALLLISILALRRVAEGAARCGAERTRP